MAIFEGATGLGRASSGWLARQTTVGIASNPHQAELAGRGVCVSRRGRNRSEDVSTACQANWSFSGGLAMIPVVLSRNSPRQARSRSKKISLLDRHGPATTRQNDANCLDPCVALQR